VLQNLFTCKAQGHATESAFGTGPARTGEKHHACRYYTSVAANGQPKKRVIATHWLSEFTTSR
jgi:hypothetical protein